MTATVFEGVTPILSVRSLTISLDYHVTVLGFQVDWDVGEIESLFEEYRSKGAKVRHLPTNSPWACEMQIEDPDGHELQLGSEPERDRPIGEWLGMRSDRWVLSPAGGWTQVEH